MGIYEIRQMLNNSYGLRFISSCYLIRGAEILRDKGRAVGSSIADKCRKGGFCALDDFELMDREIEDSRNPPGEH